MTVEREVISASRPRRARVRRQGVAPEPTRVTKHHKNIGRQRQRPGLRPILSALPSAEHVKRAPVTTGPSPVISYTAFRNAQAALPILGAAPPALPLAAPGGARFRDPDDDPMAVCIVAPPQEGSVAVDPAMGAVLFRPPYMAKKGPQRQGGAVQGAGGQRAGGPRLGDTHSQRDHRWACARRGQEAGIGLRV